MMDVTQLGAAETVKTKMLGGRSPVGGSQIIRFKYLYLYEYIFFNTHTFYAMHEYMYSVLYTLYISFSDVLCLHTSPHEHPLTVHLYMPDVFMMHLIRS